MKDVHEMFNLRFSLNFYMFHGGTNFGFIGGGKVGIIFPEAKEYVGRPEPRRDKEGSSPRRCKGVSSTNTLISDIQPVEL